MAQKEETKKHILLAAIDTIEALGVQNVTTRAIAERAGVNNAALHYYYGTKERLVEEAMALSLQHWMEDTAEQLSRPGDAREKLYAMFDYLVDGDLRYPNLIRAHLYAPLMEGQGNTALMGVFARWLELTCAELDRLFPERKEEMRMAVFSAILALLNAGLMPSLPGHPELDLRDEAARRRFVNYLVNSILGEEKRIESEE